MYTYKALITSVYDGDTVTALVDLGFHINVEIKVRLVGINAPEIKGSNKNAGIITRDRLREEILNKNVIIRTQKDKQEKYGRWLGEIWLPGDQSSINQKLIDEGLAIKYEE